MKDETAWEMASQRFHKKGVEKGRQQQEESVRVMLAEGVEQSIIALATSLTVSEIESLVPSVEP